MSLHFILSAIAHKGSDVRELVFHSIEESSSSKLNFLPDSREHRENCLTDSAADRVRIDIVRNTGRDEKSHDRTTDGDYCHIETRSAADRKNQGRYQDEDYGEDDEDCEVQGVATLGFLDISRMLVAGFLPEELVNQIEKRNIHNDVDTHN